MPTRRLAARASPANERPGNSGRNRAARERHAEGKVRSTKLVTALSFPVPLLVFELGTAIVTSIARGFAVLTLLGWRLARAQGTPPWPVIGEHLLIASTVVITTHVIGDLVAVWFVRP